MREVWVGEDTTREGNPRMRQLILLLTAMASALVLSIDVALAVTEIGTHGPDILKGTNSADNLKVRGGNDGVSSGSVAATTRALADRHHLIPL